MALVKYFKQIEMKRTEKVDSILPKDDGPLATLMPSSAIQAANSSCMCQDVGKWFTCD